MAAAATALTSVSPPPLAEQGPRPRRWTERRRRAAWRRSAEQGRRPIVIPSPARLFAVFGPTPQSASTHGRPSRPSGCSQSDDRSGRAWPTPVATLARCSMSLMSTQHDSNRFRPPVTVPIRSASSERSPRRRGAEVGLVPATRLHGMTEVTQQAHHLLGRFVVSSRGPTAGSRRLRASPCGPYTGRAGVRPELTQPHTTRT